MTNRESKIDLVSIILPVFNGANTIANAIQSVIEQSYQNWQLIIINDGSTDNTDELVAKFIDPRILYSKQENQGVSSARNSGLDLANGNFITFLDSDDSLPINSLENRLDHFKRKPDLDIVDGIVRIIEPKQDKFIRTWTPNFNGPVFEQLLIDTESCFFGPSWMLRVTDKMPRFREDMTHAEDLQYYLDYSIHGSIYGFVNSPTYTYKRSKNSAMSNLASLEGGYITLLKNIFDFEYLDLSTKYQFLNRCKSIMIKSYLSKGMFIMALKAFSSFGKKQFVKIK